MRLRKWLLACAMLVVAGCGGGGMENSGTIGVSAPSVVAADGTGTITASFASATGKNPQGVKISFATDPVGFITPDKLVATVGTDGTATTTFRVVKATAADTVVKVFARAGDLEQFTQVTVQGTGAAEPPPNVDVTQVNSIAFVKADPASITLKGTGGAGRVETSIVSFEVRDTAGAPMAGVKVNFSLNTAVGGLNLTPTFATSDAKGIVKTIVNAGIVSTPVRVTATVADKLPVISSQSDQLTVTTGLPDQDSFSIAATVLNSESYNHDGVIVPITVRLADHFNNPVPDGTALTFTASTGKIIGSAVTANGVATVNWESSGQRDRVEVTKGRLAILAYAVGEESFTDYNGSGLADKGEFIDMPEAFIDFNFNGVRNDNEPFIDFDGNGQFEAGDGKFNGLLQGPEFVGAPRTKHVFGNIQLVMSTDAASIDAVPAALNAPGQLNVTVRDLNGNTMAVGTQVTITAPFGKLTGFTSYSVPNNIGYGVTLPVALAPGDSPKAQTGFITISVKSPSGLETVKLVPVTGNF